MAAAAAGAEAEAAQVAVAEATEGFEFVVGLSADEVRARQGLTLDHFSAQLEPCLTRKYTLHPLNTT
jgi:hypothetical protein